MGSKNNLDNCELFQSPSIGVAALIAATAAVFYSKKQKNNPKAET